LAEKQREKLYPRHEGVSIVKQQDVFQWMEEKGQHKATRTAGTSGTPTADHEIIDQDQGVSRGGAKDKITLSILPC